MVIGQNDINFFFICLQQCLINPTKIDSSPIYFIKILMIGCFTNNFFICRLSKTLHWKVQSFSLFVPILLLYIIVYRSVSDITFFCTKHTCILVKELSQSELRLYTWILVPDNYVGKVLMLWMRITRVLNNILRTIIFGHKFKLLNWFCGIFCTINIVTSNECRIVPNTVALTWWILFNQAPIFSPVWLCVECLKSNRAWQQ